MSQIVIVCENGITKPHFKCDKCSCPIENASITNLVWIPKEGENWGAPTQILCKECDDRGLEEGVHTEWYELDTAFVYLMNNSNVELAKAKRRAEMVNSLSEKE